jgi:hypothetical protein
MKMVGNVILPLPQRFGLIQPAPSLPQDTPAAPFVSVKPSPLARFRWYLHPRHWRQALAIVLVNAGVLTAWSYLAN